MTAIAGMMADSMAWADRGHRAAAGQTSRELMLWIDRPYLPHVIRQGSLLNGFAVQKRKAWTFFGLSWSICQTAVRKHAIEEVKPRAIEIWRYGGKTADKNDTIPSKHDAFEQGGRLILSGVPELISA